MNNKIQKEVKNYKVIKVYKGTQKRNKVIEKGLTEVQAQRRVKEDIKINPEKEIYMLVYANR